VDRTLLRVSPSHQPLVAGQMLCFSLSRNGTSSASSTSLKNRLWLRVIAAKEVPFNSQCADMQRLYAIMTTCPAFKPQHDRRHLDFLLLLLLMLVTRPQNVLNLQLGNQGAEFFAYVQMDSGL
jgi:hypothetical protein